MEGDDRSQVAESGLCEAVRDGRPRRDGGQGLQGPTPGRVRQSVADGAVQHTDVIAAARRDRGGGTSHAGSRPHSGEQGRVGPRHSQASSSILCDAGERRAEGGHAGIPLQSGRARPAGDHLLQHAAQGGLADGEDAGQGLHGVVHARRPGPEGARHHLGGVPCRGQQGVGGNRPVRQGLAARATAGGTGHPLRRAREQVSDNEEDRLR
mmetsp:Transcript_7276/g.10275  ORF Transcript_7276/g.10275 Transcript_7276/m.10275 type:complete len:209 (+) Transcript_7276:704-1330(+)